MKMPMYDLKVVVEYFYEVEAETEEQAEELGWHYEDHAYSGEVYSIEVRAFGGCLGMYRR